MEREKQQRLNNAGWEAGSAEEFLCQRDHYTPEERAVIEAALKWYEWVDQLEKLSDAEVALVNAASRVRHRRLLATRAKTEETGNESER